MLNSYISISKNRLFVWSAIVLILLLIVFHVIYIEKFSRHVLKNDLSTKIFHTIQKEGKMIKVAAIGTSHTSDALRNDDTYFFNYGRSSTWYPQVAYAKVSHLLKYAPNMKVLLLEVDHISILAYDHKIHTSLPENYLYLLKHVSETLSNERRVDLYDEKSPFFVSLQADVAPVIHRKFLQSYLLDRGKTQEGISHWTTLTDKEKIENATKRTHSYMIDTPSEIDPAVRDYYIKAITKAKNQGVKVYLIFYPQSKEYLSAIHKKNNVQVDTFVSTLSKEENITILDYRHYFDSNESAFENQDHINKKASKIFTKEIMQVIHNDL